VQRILARSTATGLTSVLAARPRSTPTIRPSGHPGLTILPTGPYRPIRLSCFIAGHEEVIRELGRRATDLVVFDRPPTLLVADAMLLAVSSTPQSS